MIFSTVYLCISTVYCISLFGWSQLWGLFFFPTICHTWCH
jgi:hypothetical protein